MKPKHIEVTHIYYIHLPGNPVHGLKCKFIRQNQTCVTVELLEGKASYKVGHQINVDSIDLRLSKNEKVCSNCKKKVDRVGPFGECEDCE